MTSLTTLLITLSLSTASTVQQKTDKATLDKQLQELLTKYAPTKDCNNGYQAGKLDEEPNSPSTSKSGELTKEEIQKIHDYNKKVTIEEFEKDLACMLAGYKDVFLADMFNGDDTGAKAFITEKYNALLKAHDIHCISGQNTRTTETEGDDSIQLSRIYILYTPRGKTRALLLLQDDLEAYTFKEERNAYLMGDLLGYPEKSKYDFYHHPWDTAWEKERFPHHKKEALEYIKKNEPTIEQWIQDNTKEYAIVDTLGLH